MTTRCHTFTGTGFDPFNPRPEDIRIEDIAHHLAMTCRYGGAVPVYYSVAEHAIRVSNLVQRVSGDASLALLALHHDSAEAYIHDIRRPIKGNMMIDIHGSLHIFETFENEVQEAIRKALLLPDPDVDDRKLIQAADNTMLRVELRGLFGEDLALGDLEKIFAAADRPALTKATCMTWAAAKSAFLLHHERLVRAARGAA